MASSSYSSQKVLGELEELGNRILLPSNSLDELLNLLDKLEHLLSKVGQAPPRSMQHALFRPMKALISNELLRHSDMDVKVSVASCMSELIRITAPVSPYDGEVMKEIFQLTIIAFEKLSYESGPSYFKAIQILENVANVRSCLLMLDLECDAVIVEMFQQFLNTIRSNHPHAVFSHMEAIMTLVIEESDVISVELLNLLLSSVKKENQNASPLSWKLGEKVLTNCAAKLKPHFIEVIKSTSIAFDDYAEVVTSICRDEPGKEHVAKEVAPDANCLADIGPSMGGLSKSVMDNGTSPTRNDDALENENSLNTLQHCHQTKKQGNTDARTGPQPEKQDARGAVQPETDPTIPKERDRKLQHCHQTKKLENTDARTGPQPEKQDARETEQPETDPAIQKKRNRKPNSMIKPEEGYEHYWITGRSKLLEIPHSRKNQGVKIGYPPKNSTYKESATSAKCVTEESGDKAFGMPRGIKEYGEELVGRRINIWWPLDQMFYEGVISSFYPSEKKHKVSYVDGVEEILNLSVQRFQLLGNMSPDREQPTNLSSPDALSDKPWKKKAKTKSEPPRKKEHYVSSSKRDNADNSTVDLLPITDKSKDEKAELGGLLK